MSTSSKLQSAIRLALNVGAGASALAIAFAPNAFAQNTNAKTDQNKKQLPRMEVEETVVTGSRIKRADVASASPVTMIDRSAITATGLTDVGNLIQRMPAMSGSPIGTTTNNGGNGAVYIDLRGMGVNRTLTLVNGRRTVDGGDYQTIPADMIDHVEILKDGGSATYGADAVSGVVNIITRRDFQGVEVNYQHADWFRSSGKQDTVGLIAGTQFAGGNFVFGAEFVKQDPAFQSDVPWDFMQNSYYIYPEGCEHQVAAPYDGTPQGGCYPLGSSRIPESRLPFFSQGTFLIGTPATQPYQVGLMIPHDGRTYNYAPVNYLQTPYERTNIFGEAHFNLSEHVRFNAEFRGNYRTSAQELAPLPYTAPDPMYNGFWQGQPYSGISQDNYYLRKAVDAYNAANGTHLIYEPVVLPRRRMIETNRRFEQTITQYQWTAGLEGDFRNVSWNVYINEGVRTRENRDYGQFSGQRLQNALGPSADLNGDGQPECYQDINDPSTLIAGCVPLNMFGGGVVDPVTSQPTLTTLTQDMIDYVSINTIDGYDWRQRQAGISLTGKLFDLPGGKLGWAVGWDYLRNEYTYSPDSAKLIGAVTGNVGAGTHGHLSANSFYGEILAPLYDNGEQSIVGKAGYRYDDYNQFSGHSTIQLGLEFNVMKELKLRGTYGTVFRAPTVSELFGGLVDSFPTYSDPCIPPAGQALPPGCAQVGIQNDTQVHTRVGGNVNLKPETGDTWTAGIVWTPHWGDNSLTATIDYWQIKLDDAISTLGVDNILNQCYVSQNPDACSLIHRAANYSFDGNAYIQDSNLNVAKEGAKGYDVEVRYNFDSPVGEWQAAFLWAHMLERTATRFPTAPQDDLVGRFTDPTATDGGAYPADKINYSLKWMFNDFSIGYLGEYISALEADTFCNCGAGNQPDGTYRQHIDSYLYHDIVANYTFKAFGFETTLSGGITNLTDEAPPFIEVGFNATTDPTLYRMFGRGYYLRVAVKF